MPARSAHVIADRPPGPRPPRLVAASLGLVLVGSVFVAAGTAQAVDPVLPIFVEGQAQVVPGFNVSADWIRERLWVETEFDTDGDGLLDRMHVDVTRQRQTDTEGLKVPVIYESSPYYAGTASTASQYFWNANHELGATPPPRTSPPDISYNAGRTSVSTSEVSTWLPRGFAVVHSDSVGTGLSDGCPTVGGINESLAPKAVIDWLNGRANGYTTRTGTTPMLATWSTGKVGMTGTSYNGTLPLAAATTGVEGLEAIIPIAPNTSYYHYYRSNGLVRNPGGWVGEDVDYLFDYISSGLPANRPYCRATVRDGLMKAQHDRVTGDYNAFWASRDYLNQLDNLHAATFMTHAFNDWNVVPEHSVRIYEALKGRGIPLMAYYHQGAHGGAPPLPLRNLWFTRYLYGIDNGVENDPKGWIVRTETGACPPRAATVNGDQSNTATLIVADTSPFNRGMTLTVPQLNSSGTTTNTTREILAIPDGTTLVLASAVATATGQKVANGAIVSMGCSTTNPTPYADYPNPAAADVSLNLQAGGNTAGGGLSLASASPIVETFNDIVNCQAGGLTTLAAQQGNRLLYRTPTLTSAVHISGTPSVTVRMAASKAAANLSVTVVKLPWSGGSTCTSSTQATTTSVITRAWADPKNHGDQFGTETPLTPGEFVDVTFNLEPDDQVITAGSQIGLLIHSSDPEFTVRPAPGTQLSVDLARTRLTLPVVGGAPALGAAIGASAPSIGYTLDPASPDGDNGWYRSPVAIDWTVNEGGAETSLIGCVDETIETDGAAISRTCEASSVVGSDGPVTASFDRDATAPTVEVTGVVDGGVYILGTTPAAGCSTSDDLSGVAAAASLSITGGPVVGYFTATCADGRDNAGNLTTTSATYQVVYDFGGFRRPLGDTNTPNAGSALPVKFSLAGFQGMAIFATGFPKFQQASCSTGDPIGAAVSTKLADPMYYADGQYVYPWKTLKNQAGTCGWFTARFIDATTHTAWIAFPN